MKTTLTSTERLQLIGLMALAQRHSDMLKQIGESVGELCGDLPNDPTGHITDSLYDYHDADRLLSRLKIAVE